MTQCSSTVHSLWTDGRTTDRRQWYHRCLQHNCKRIKNVYSI